MKKNLIIIVLTILCSYMAFAQNKKGKSQTQDAIGIQDNWELEIVTYAQAMKYGDAGVAVNSLYLLMVKHPENTSYKDSLARLYFQVGSYSQCLRVCEDISKTKPMDTTILRMMAMSNQNTGHAVEAITELETVIKITGNVFDLYQKAAIEYGIKRLQESKISIETVIAKARDDDKITLYYEKDKKQEVPLKAAAFNLYGMVAKEFNDTASARFLFAKAIKLYSEFYLANFNLNALNDSSNKKPVESVQANNNKQGNLEKKKAK